MYGLEVCKGLDMDPAFLTLAYDLRKELFGEGQAHPSRYNAAVIVSRCAVCGVAAQGDLETHHIVPQAAADAAGRIAPGKHKNAEGNLVVLCGACHDKHHSGLLEIQGWIQTTDGRKLKIANR
jgi:5-methylcytosine-specific restriction endonuclease McrA